MKIDTRSPMECKKKKLEKNFKTNDIMVEETELIPKRTLLIRENITIYG